MINLINGDLTVQIKPSHRSRKFWKQQNKVYNAFSLESLQRLFNNVDWKQLLERLLNQKKDGIRKKVDIENFSWENITLYVPYPDYLVSIQFNCRLLIDRKVTLKINSKTKIE